MEINQMLRIEIKNSQPIELIDLTKSLLSVSAEYKRFVSKNYKTTKKEETILYIREIRSGSAVIELISIAIPILPLFGTPEGVATIIQFGFHLKTYFDYLCGRNDQRPTDLSKTDYQNCINFVEPIAKDQSSQVVINQVVNGNATVILQMDSRDANIAQNVAKREIQMLTEPLAGMHQSVILYWQQVNKDTTNQAGDKVIIESIYPLPVKVIFENETALSSIILGIENPFIYGYLVDVCTETIQGKPVLYKVQNIHGRVDYPPQITIT